MTISIKKYIFFFSILYIPSILCSQGLTSYNTSSSYAGYTLFPLNNKAYLIDNCGKIVNEWMFNSAATYCTYLMENGNIFFMGAIPQTTFNEGGGGSGSLEIRDINNNLVWSYQYYSPNSFSTHHDAEVMPNGNILLIVWEVLSIVEAIEIGRAPNYISGDAFWPLKVVEIEPVGTNQINTVWEWHIKDHIIQDYNTAFANYGVVADNPQLIDINIGGAGKDWLHANGIDYNKYLDQIAISLRDLDEIIIIDHSTTTAEAASHSGGKYGKGGDILYRWGNPQNYGRGTAANKTLNDQHDVRWVRKDFTMDGAISVFNNQGAGNSKSSVDVFYPPMDSPGFYSQPINNSAPYGPLASDFKLSNGPNGSFYSIYQGGMQVLPNGNALVTDAWNQDMFELDGNTGNVVWSYCSPIDGNAKIFKAIRYLANDIELSNYNLIPSNNTVESPSSNITLNCTNISYEAFCLSNYIGEDILTGTINDIKDYETDGIIESVQILQSGATVDYDSNTEIILSNGFEVKLNVDFYAFIDGCNNGLGGLN